MKKGPRAKRAQKRRELSVLSDSTVNLGFDPEEIGTELKFGTQLLWVVPNNISKILSNPLWGKKVAGVHVFCRPK